MKSNSQPLKLFLVAIFSCTNLLASLTPAIAEPTLGSSLSDAYARLRLRSDAKTTHNKVITFNQPAIPPGPPPGGRVRGGAKRGKTKCEFTKLNLTALVASTEEANSTINVWGKTTLEHPSWFFYVPYTKDFPYPVEFVLQDLDSNEIYKKAIALPEKPGVISVSLPTTSPGLALDKQYRWFFTIYCDRDKNFPPIYVEGVIKRVALNPAAVKELETTELLKRYAIYAQNGIWYEALAILAQLRQKNPQDAVLKAEWQNLLGSVHLDDIAAEPIISE